MVRITNDHFSIVQICRSGQCFRMEELADEKAGTVALVAFGRYLEVRQDGNEIIFDCTQEEYDSVWKDYFDMETDYAAVIKGIDATDKYLVSAAEFGTGIRILRQELWEMIISFIISQQNNIKRIRKCVRLLCEAYGEKKTAQNGIDYYEFPTPYALSTASVEDLYACNLGYRSRYIYETANAVLRREIDLERLFLLDYAEANKELLKLCGVGKKVADCICLFALHKTEAFPKDTHINKALAAQYPNGFPFDRYGADSGILQQYIFYYDLNRNRK
ncbi:MAG: 8-oxoguanine DNA glycosylase [Lachnospiraceae bacterium]|nr:8-oxoguanine DNA glycosylase [Lachnospiraceae bacterium]